MNTLTKLMILLIILIGSSCNNKKTGIDKLLGSWGYSGDTVIVFSKNDTTVLGVLSTQINSMQSGSVLFKEIKMLSDTAFTAKGLYLKPVYRTERVFVKSWSYYTPDHYEDQQVFDHNESIWVDYRMLINDNFLYYKVMCSKLSCIPYNEGQKWEFIGMISPENKAIIDAEKQRIVEDSVIAARNFKRIQDSITSVREYIYENGQRRRRDFNPPITLKFNLIELEDGESVDKFKVLKQEKEKSITSIYYLPNGKFDRIIIHGEKNEIIKFWSEIEKDKINYEMENWITPNEMSDSAKVFATLKKFLGIQEWKYIYWQQLYGNQ